MDDPFAYQGRQGGAGTQPLSGQSKPLSETKSVPAHFPFPLAPQGRWGGGGCIPKCVQCRGVFLSEPATPPLRATKVLVWLLFVYFYLNSIFSSLAREGTRYIL